MNNKYLVQHFFRGSMSKPFLKISSISDDYAYTTIQTKLPSNIIRIRIHAMSCVQIYSYIC